MFGFIYFESSNAFLSEENKPKKTEKEEGGEKLCQADLHGFLCLLFLDPLAHR